jgi:DNA-binding PadR family transcriptional regulator
VSDKLNRELTTLEYTILGLLAIEPQSGYAIISKFETGNFRWSASAGSIYPVLKRLENQDFIDSKLEVVYETRPRKVYALLPKGEQTLDEWLREEPEIQDVVENFDIALHKFVIMERRLSARDVLNWLNAYEVVATAREAVHRVMHLAANQEMALSLHEQLAVEATSLEIGARLTWIQTARARISAQIEST